MVADRAHLGNAQERCFIKHQVSQSNQPTMTDLSMILLSLGMLVFFMGPFVIISAIKDRKKSRRKQITLARRAKS